MPSSSRLSHILLTALGATLCVSAAWAHHGWSSYDESTEISITGTVVESNYQNPHATLVVESDGKSWVAWLAPLNRMAARGLNSEMVQAGANVTLVGYASTVTTTDEMRAERIIIDGTAYEMR